MQKEKYYFMAGLPRSGSTLLSSILNQNPRIHSGPNSPVLPVMWNIINTLNADEMSAAYPKPQQYQSMVWNTIEHYYEDVSKPIVIDKNRAWAAHVQILDSVMDPDNDEIKIIVPVRNLDEILASFISMCNRNPFHINGTVNFIDRELIKRGSLLNDENRCLFLATQGGILGDSLEAIKNLLMEGKQKLLHFVEYEDLVNSPEETMRNLYDFLGEEYYEHDFNNIKNKIRENDEFYGFADMHEVRETIGKSGIDPMEVLPETIYQQSQGQEFWRQIETMETPNQDQINSYSHLQEVPEEIQEEEKSTNFIGA